MRLVDVDEMVSEEEGRAYQKVRRVSVMGSWSEVKLASRQVFLYILLISLDEVVESR